MDIDRPPDIVVVAGGAPPASGAGSLDPRLVPMVVAADSGVALARRLGLEVDVAVGDFDSLDPDLVDRLDELAGDVRRHPEDKTATDLELALDTASERAPARVLVLGLEGGRPDHALANLLVAASPRYVALEIELALDLGRAWVVRDRLDGAWTPGTTISVIPVHGAATVSIAGVRWPLDRSTLAPGTTRGVSNVTNAPSSSLSVHDGVVLCIVPRTLEAPE